MTGAAIAGIATLASLAGLGLCVGALVVVSRAASRVVRPHRCPVCGVAVEAHGPAQNVWPRDEVRA